ncbi:helix-turn-helix domain-containing protein [Chitinibacter sp. S2-10]|uniref:helix-turn-helix domain-containing protein n=1 Tax=Chitinibacter sp. S2-10 TaxID=3373597 RepID=UPI00397789FD
MTEQPETNPSPFLPAGRQLRTAREAMGFSIDDVAGQLKLSRRQIQALENEDFDQLPSNLFIRGFVRNYARLVQIDAEPLLEYLHEVLPRDEQQVSSRAVYVEAGPVIPESQHHVGEKGSPKPVVVSLLGALIGIGLVYWYLQQPTTPDVALPTPAALELVDASAASAVAEALPTVEPTAASSLMSAGAASSATAVLASKPVASMVQTKIASAASGLTSAAKASMASAVAAGSVDMSIVTESDSWVQIIDRNGNQVLSEIVRPGYERKVVGLSPFAVKVGNAPKTKLTIQGRPVDLSSHLKPGSDVVNLEVK